MPRRVPARLKADAAMVQRDDACWVNSRGELVPACSPHCASWVPARLRPWRVARRAAPEQRQLDRGARPHPKRL